MLQIGWTGLVNGFRITFSSGYFVTCWSGVCTANSENGAPAFTSVFLNEYLRWGSDPYQVQAAWGSCIEIKSATSERVTAVRLGDYTNGQSEWSSNAGKHAGCCFDFSSAFWCNESYGVQHPSHPEFHTQVMLCLGGSLHLGRLRFRPIRVRTGQTRSVPSPLVMPALRNTMAAQAGTLGLLP